MLDSRRIFRFAVLTLSVSLGLALPCAADVRLPRIFGNQMVLQRGLPVPRVGDRRFGRESHRLDRQKRVECHRKRAGEMEGRAASAFGRKSGRGEGQRQEHDHASRRSGRRGLGLLRTVEHGLDRPESRQCEKGDRGGDASANPALLGSAHPEGQAGRRRGRLLERMHARERSLLLGRRVLLRPVLARAAWRSDRVDQHVMGRNTD